MSQENREVVRRAIGAMSFHAAAEGHTRTALVERLDSEVEFEEDSRFPEARIYRGRSEVLRYFSEFVSEFEHYVFKLEELVDAGGDDVLACLRIHGQGKEAARNSTFGRAGSSRSAAARSSASGLITNVRKPSK